ncbi:hypothetical protein QTP70_032558 [Hemibagrus guttatus]|uniref:Uncharacterized protein n=1 Tax=Hemibagrus guttatus TaxID=175788 RepID=A0AAE0V3E5_9TELE|nr:hypothetical protein QTP70_032558 [Hemibagrus guttatus]
MGSVALCKGLFGLYLTGTGAWFALPAPGVGGSLVWGPQDFITANELWVITERMRSRIQAAKMSFLCRVAGRSLRDRLRSSVTQEEFGVKPLLLHIERGQLRWLGHLFRMPPGRLPGEVFRACPTGKRPRGRPRTRWRDYVPWLTWERLGILPEELEEVFGEREVSASLLRLLPPRPGSR